MPSDCGEGEGAGAGVETWGFRGDEGPPCDRGRGAGFGGCACEGWCWGVRAGVPAPPPPRAYFAAISVASSRAAVDEAAELAVEVDEAACFSHSRIPLLPQTTIGGLFLSTTPPW